MWFVQGELARARTALQRTFARGRPGPRARGRGLRRRLSVLTDGHWTPWLPTYAWVIDHPEGVIVVDTGQGAHLLDAARLLHPYHRWQVAFRLEREEEIGPQLRALGIGARDVRHVALTHLHVDHDGGLAHFPQTKILVSRGELATARGWKGRPGGYLPQRWPTWLDPVPLHLARDSYGPFSASTRLTVAGDVVAVAMPGHTADHVSVVVEDQGTTELRVHEPGRTSRPRRAQKRTQSHSKRSFRVEVSTLADERIQQPVLGPEVA